MSNALPFIIKPTFVTVFVDGKPFSVHSSVDNYDTVLHAIRAERWDEVKELVNPSVKTERKIKEVGADKSGIAIEGGRVTYYGEVISNRMATRMVEMLENGFDITPYKLGLENLLENPDYRATREAFGFFEENNMPLTPDGHFLAYKKVRADFTDVHTGTFDNSPGSVVAMRRNAVNPDKNQTCSDGLHVCAYSYLPHYWGDRVVLVKINPMDIVSVPTDYKNAKCRVCQYEVLEEITDWKDGEWTGANEYVYDDLDESVDEIEEEEDADESTIDGIDPVEEEDQPIYYFDSRLNRYRNRVTNAFVKRDIAEEYLRNFKRP